MGGLDWQALFGLSVPPLEMVVRGTAIYWFLFLIFRLFVRRDAGSIGLADILLLVIIADAAQNAMAGDYRSITDGMILIATIVGWNILLDWAAYRSRTMQRLLEPPQLVLVKNGQIQYPNLRRQFMSEQELMSKLREHGVGKLAEVKRAYLEGSGTITVIRHDGAPPR
jgi:uncharacterized membrane protein YcaP (DUF421 family)